MKSQAQKASYHMVSCTYKAKNEQVQRERQVIDGQLLGRKGKEEVTSNVDGVSFVC